MAGSSDPDKLMSKADKLTKLSFTRWNADWKSATSLYEQAAIAYRFRKDNEKAKDAFEKASKGQEMISSPWDAAKHMESAAALAKELERWNEVSDFYHRASEFDRDNEVKIINCLVENIIVDISFNQVGGQYALQLLSK